MIHIATVHWKTSKWIDIQLRYLTQHIQSDFRVYAFLNDIPEEYGKKFYYVCSEPIAEHAIKLNLLAERISWNGNERDIIIFLDGDAFPVTDNFVQFIESKVGLHKLIAIQRSENQGDIQPHPSFCATTIGFWNEIKGDWKMGYLWRDSTGTLVTDVGGNLLSKLQQLQVNWLPIRRSNKRNLHPVWFGVYGDLIYHHGAGFREPFGRVDSISGGIMINLWHRINLFCRTLAAVTERRFNEAIKPVISKNQETENVVFSRMEKNPFFYKDFL